MKKFTENINENQKHYATNLKLYNELYELIEETLSPKMDGKDSEKINIVGTEDLVKELAKIVNNQMIKEKINFLKELAINPNLIQEAKLKKELNENYFNSTEKDSHGLKNWLLSMNVRDYTVNDDFSIDVDGDVDLSERKLVEIPYKFNNVKGNFFIYDNNLTTLNNCPNFVGDNFGCDRNYLITLEGGPKEVKGSYDCSKNRLKDLTGCAENIGGHFNCTFNNIESLTGFPKKVGSNVFCDNNVFGEDEIRKICNVGNNVVMIDELLLVQENKNNNN
jgi:hypothetical protein